MASTGVETVERLRETGTPGRHGARGSEEATPIHNTTLIPRTSSEDVDGRDTVVIGYTLVCPPGTDLKATDRIRARGERWSIDGMPGDYRTKRGKAKAVMAALTRVEG